MDEKKEYYLKIAFKFCLFAVVLFGIWLGYKTAMFYLPFVVGFMIASMAEPIIKFFMKHAKWNRKLASIITLLLISVVLGVGITILVSSIITESSKLISNLNEYGTELYNWGMGIFEDVQSGRIEIPNEVIQIAEKSLGTLIEGLKSFIGNFFSGVINTITSIPNWITSGVITLLSIIFICFDREYVIGMVRKHVPSKWIEKTKFVFQQTCSVALEYIKAEAKLSSFCFILVLVGLIGMDLFGLEVEYPIIMAIFIGFVDLLPIFGAGTVMLPWAVYLLFAGNLPLAIGVAILWGIWAILKNLMEPKMISNQMGMHPIFTLLGMYTGMKLFGILGLMLGPILLLVLKNVFQELISKGVFKTIFEQE